MEKLEQLRRQECFDPANPDSKPTSAQQEVINDFGSTKIQVIRAGTQCLAKGTLVTTSKGPVPIEEIRVGDIVYSEHGTPIKVLKTFDNGPKRVYQLWHETMGVLAEATENHVWLTTQGQLKTSELAGNQLVVYGKKPITPEIIGNSIQHTYDIHVDSPTNLYLLANGLVTHNSGKSQTCSRLITWVLAETHPTWKRPPEWGSEPLLGIVAGRTSKQLEESLLPKIRSFLEPGTYKEVRIGNIIQRLELTNGNRIVFQSLENPNMARERIQSYVAHIAWIDELPPTVDVMDELLRRVQARNGYFLASFTPLVRSVSVQKFVDTLQEPLAKTYRFKMLDNPLYSDETRKAEILSSLSHLPEHVRSSRLYGDWMSDDNAVFYFDYHRMVELPQDYSPLWRHVESVDPAIKSALGYTLWAENPQTGIWYCIKAEYVKGIYVPTELVSTVAKMSANYNIVRRISDPHESWYIHTAASMGLAYTGVYKKNDRKAELIKNFQEELGKSLRVAPTADLLIDEITSARWSDARDGKIASGSDYHLLDSSQYFLDVRPKKEAAPQTSGNWQSWLYAENEKRKQSLEKSKIELSRRMIQRRGRHAQRFQ